VIFVKQIEAAHACRRTGPADDDGEQALDICSRHDPVSGRQVLTQLFKRSGAIDTQPNPHAITRE
jgi:hypothetical protein